jgi:hypothetical protein
MQEQRRSRKKNAHHSNVKAATYKITSCAVAAAHLTHKHDNTGDTTNTLPRCLSLSARTFTECKQNTSFWMIYIECSSSFVGFFSFAVFLGDSWQQVRVPDTTVLATSKEAADLDRLWV